MKSKKCTKCKETKPLNQFGKKKSNIDGYRYSCKNCTNSYEKKLRENNEEYYKKQLKNREDWAEKTQKS